jgi:hypothetical protein
MDCVASTSPDAGMQTEKRPGDDPAVFSSLSTARRKA